MNTETYLEGRIAKLESEISDRTLELASCIQPAEWSAFAKSATSKVDKAYEAFCTSIRWRVTRSWSAGASSIKMGARTKAYFLQHGKFRLIAAVEERAFVRFPALYPTSDSPYDYPELSLTTNRERRVQGYLSFDFDQASPLLLCSGGSIESTRSIDARIPGSEKQVDITSLTKEAIIEQEDKLSSLLSEFGRVGAAVLRRDRLRQRISSLEKQIRVLKSAKTVFRKVHLPIAQVTEVLEQLERLVGPTQMAPALLLKGPSGTGKTLLAEKIAEAGFVHFLKAGVNTLKKSNLGESAAAVQTLWRNARAMKPCVLFVDECDSIFGKRGSANTDTVSQEITNAFLAEWSGKEAGVWVVGATNRREIVDDAILSRFGLELDITHPDDLCRAAILLQELEAAGYPGPLPDNAARLTQGMSGRDLTMLAQRFAGKSAAEFPTVIRQIRSAASPSVDEQASWDTLIVSDDTKNSLQTTCALLRDAEGWAKRGVAIPNGILLEGPAGTGKTQIARTIANEASLGFVKATLADLKGQFLGHAASNVRDIFEKARAVSPAILFIDELDIVAPRRDGGSSNDALAQEMISQLLQEMEGIVSQSRRVFVLAATNFPESIDSAILSRFTERIVIPLPDLTDRIRFLKLTLDKAQMKKAVSGDDLRILGQLSEGMSNRDLKNWVSLAQRLAVGRAIVDPERYDMTFDDLMNTIPEAARCRTQGIQGSTSPTESIL
jgi:SpoVK/Ycf46/Vps4 family AAA+-type ATPase